MNKRDTILEMALIEFSRNDFENASVNKIIKDANTSKGNFYHYFNNKEDLYIVLMKEAWHKKMEFMTISHKVDIFTYLQKQVLAGIQFSRENPEYYQLSRRFTKEKNTNIYNRVLEEIACESNKSELNSIMGINYEYSTISNEFPNEFVDSFIQLVINNVDELMVEEEDLSKIEEKLLLLMKVLRNGLEKK